MISLKYKKYMTDMFKLTVCVTFIFFASCKSEKKPTSEKTAENTAVTTPAVETEEPEIPGVPKEVLIKLKNANISTSNLGIPVVDKYGVLYTNNGDFQEFLKKLE